MYLPSACFSLSFKRLMTSFVLCCLVTVLFLPSVQGQQTAKPGDFDFYLFVLSWSPEFCATHQTKPECTSGHHSFVVHGLWPQWTNGKWPQTCSHEPNVNPISEVADLMDPDLAAHEWAKHGTCSGLSAEDYFGMIRKLFTAVVVPPLLKNLDHTTSLSPAKIKSAFLASNPDFTKQSIVIGCQKDLVDVKLCLDKDGKAEACQAVTDCRKAKILVRPVPQ